jgi:hypothetical protein
MRTPEASQTDTRKLISQLLTVKDAAMKSPGAVPPRNLHFLTLLNNLSNLHFFCPSAAATPDKNIERL